MLRLPFLAVALSALAVACSTGAEDAAASSEDMVSEGIVAKETDPCTATLVFLQKDAYRASGRSNELWPAHTTTVLEVSCQTAQGEQRISPYKENYGTKPGTKDAQGNDVLVKVDMPSEVVTTSAPWGKMRELVASFEGCGCDPAGFLGLDTIDKEGQTIVEKLAPILECPDGSDAILLALKEKRFDEAKQMAARCRVRDGVSPTELANQMAEVEAEVKRTLSEHHVCNNNALLQADLFGRFRDRGDAQACNPHDRGRCYGPMLFFDPTREVH